MINLFLNSFVDYCWEILPSIMLGFFISGVFNEFIPKGLVDKYLGDKGVKAIFLSSLIGVILPVCCFGSLPLAVTMRRKGARLGPVLAFLVATPATSVSALIVCWRLLGAVFTAYIFFAVILMGLVVGIIGNNLHHHSEQVQGSSSPCCHAEQKGEESGPKLSLRIIRIFKYAFVQLPREIGFELLLGIALASFVVVYSPFQRFIQRYFAGFFGYIMLILVGLLTYVCSTASVPLADAIIRSGLTPGHAMTFLLVGPITSYGTIFVLKKEFGGKVLSIYLFTISVLSLILGYSFSHLLNIS